LGELLAVKTSATNDRRRDARVGAPGGKNDQKTEREPKHLFQRGAAAKDRKRYLVGDLKRVPSAV